MIYYVFEVFKKDQKITHFRYKYYSGGTEHKKVVTFDKMITILNTGKIIVKTMVDGNVGADVVLRVLTNSNGVDSDNLGSLPKIDPMLIKD